MRERICVLAWKEPGISGVSRGEKLHVCGEAQFMADELNREWPSIHHWAAPATDVELAAHARQAARLMAAESALKGGRGVLPKRVDGIADDVRWSA
jgi:hypothetical protein